ncbi:pimeloyl-ACP methyl ester esterase BioH [Methylotuvimicrobium sp. KM1]|uniref:pimeloyl-ACP methyl ester esterase BioH n=1 Tax=Methylotuvimicrobium sp. KM1 TaxID=3377707 RepID=UPI00384EEE8F
MTIHYQVYGEGEPVVLVHGWAMHSGIWRDFAEQLAQTRRVVCVDLPGHGLSAEMPEFTLESVCEQLSRIVDSKACWIGWSLGGSVSLAMARLFPEAVSSVVLLASNPCFVENADWPGMPENQLDLFAKNLSVDCESTLLRFLSLQINGLPEFKTLSKKLSAALRESRMPTAKTLQDGLTVLKQADLRQVLAELRLPVAAMLGEKDTLVPVRIGEAMQAINPYLHLSVIKNAGHAPFLSHRPELIESLNEFLAQP